MENLSDNSTEENESGQASSTGLEQVDQPFTNEPVEPSVGINPQPNESTPIDQTTPTGVSPQPAQPVWTSEGAPIGEQPTNGSGEKKGVWRSVVTILALIVMPLVGIILTWILTSWSKTAKIIITIVFSIFQVIAIIGILAAITLVGLGSARVKARDTMAKNSMKTVANTLEMYYEDSLAMDKDGKAISSYPVGKSYTAMIEELNSKMAITMSNSLEGYAYDYRYCSTNGNDFILQVILQSTKEPYEITSPDGNDNCTPGR